MLKILPKFKIVFAITLLIVGFLSFASSKNSPDINSELPTCRIKLYISFGGFNESNSVRRFFLI